MKSIVHEGKIAAKHFLTFDVEDWFHILDVGMGAVNGERNLESRVLVGLEKILAILDQNKTLATFFVLGGVAQKQPELVRMIQQMGHEIASHGYDHTLCGDNPAVFRENIYQGKCILEDISGAPVEGYRAPGFSITRKNAWAFDVIGEVGYSYDASIFPGRHGHGGIAGLPRVPFHLITKEGRALDEFPMYLHGSPLGDICFSGGGYFRITPWWIMRALIKNAASRDETVMIYLHPRDLDPDAPKVEMNRFRRFKCYINVANTEIKCDKLLQTFSFRTISSYRNTVNKRQTVDLREFLIGSPRSKMDYQAV
jgi:polysaccharide deacetylase family protein (PEP-CTERM system associated)